MADGHMENVQVLFSDIAECIWFYWKNCKAKTEQAQYS